MTDLSGPAYDAMIESGKALAAKMFAYGVKLYFNHHGAIRARQQGERTKSKYDTQYCE